MTRTSLIRVALILLVGFISTNCGGTPYVPPENTGPSAATETKNYTAVGTVKGLKPETPSIEIEHEEIKGLMPAMEMEFHVTNKSLLEGLAVGDRIDFTVEHGVGGLRVVAIRKK